MKLGRNYIVTITTDSGYSVTVEPPFSVEFTVDRSMRASVNNCTMTLYNLKESVRNNLYKDKYSLTAYWPMTIMAGYGDNLYQLFQGNITECYSVKQNTEWQTKITAYDGSYQINNGFIATAFSSGTNKTDMIKQFVAAMPNLALGALGSSVSGSSDRGYVAIGNPFDNIQELSENTGFIDNEKLNILGNTEVLKGDVFVLDSGVLFETPQRRDAYLELNTLFAPEIQIARIVEIQSEFTKFNGQYQCWGIKHNFQYLGNMGGKADTTLSLNAGAKVFQEVS